MTSWIAVTLGYWWITFGNVCGCRFPCLAGVFLYHDYPVFPRADPSRPSDRLTCNLSNPMAGAPALPMSYSVYHIRDDEGRGCSREPCRGGHSLQHPVHPSGDVSTNQSRPVAVSPLGHERTGSPRQASWIDVYDHSSPAWVIKSRADSCVGRPVRSSWIKRPLRTWSVMLPRGSWGNVVSACRCSR